MNKAQNHSPGNLQSVDLAEPNPSEEKLEAYASNNDPQKILKKTSVEIQNEANLEIQMENLGEYPEIFKLKKTSNKLAGRKHKLRILSEANQA